ncbi:MAG: hypothetical protein EGQ20_12375 [Bacteroides oleiciplenus]|nr:hypothetical protein [Bacteroides oleiciplenus]
MLRTNSVLSSLRGTSNRRRYGASAARIRLGYGSDKEELNTILSECQSPCEFYLKILVIITY